MQSQRITSIIMGVIVIVVGLVLETTILSQAATAASGRIYFVSIACRGCAVRLLNRTGVRSSLGISDA